MSTQLLCSATITPANTPMEVSTNGGTSFTPLVFATVGSNQRGTLRGVPAGTYAIGQLIIGAVGQPSTRQANPAIVTIITAAATPTEVSVFGHSQNSDDTNYPLRLPSWPTLLKQGGTFPAGYAVVANPSVAGAMMPAILANQLNVYTRPVTAGSSPIFTLWGFVNDAGQGRTAAQIQTDITTFVSTTLTNYPAAKIIILTEPRGHAERIYTTYTNAQIYGILSTVHAWLRAGQPGVALVADLEADRRLDLQIGQGSNSDSLHLDQPRRQMVADTVLPAVQAALGGSVGVFTLAGGAVAYGSYIVPFAPDVLADDAADTLTYSHALGTSEILVSINAGTFAAYAGPYAIGNVALAAGYYQAKIRAATGRTESALTPNPAFTLAAASPSTGPTMPTTLTWLAKFSADTGLVNQVSGGPNLTAGTTPPVLTANQYGTRAAWVYAKANDQSWALALTTTAPQHFLVAIVVTPTAWSQYGGMFLGASANSLYWHDSGVSTQYVQATAVNGTIPLNTPTVLVMAVSTGGLARIWTNGVFTAGPAATAIPTGSFAFQMGRYGTAAAPNWSYDGKYASLNIATAAGGFTDQQMIDAGTALRTYYGI